MSPDSPVIHAVDATLGARWRWIAGLGGLLVAGALLIRLLPHGRADLDALLTPALMAALALFAVSAVAAHRQDRRRDRAERLQRESEETYRSMVLSLSEGVLIFGPDGHVRAANPSAEKILGRSAETMKANALSDWVTLDTDGKPMPLQDMPVYAALTQGTAQRDVTIGDTLPDGSIRWMNVNAEPLRDGPSHLAGAVVSFTDVTDRRAVDAALKESEAAMRALMNAMEDGVFVTQDHRCVYANAALARALDYAPGELIDMPFDRLVVPDMLDMVSQRFTERAGSGAEPPRVYDIRLLTKGADRELDFELVAARVTYKGRPAAIGVLREIGERKKIVEELAHHRQRLEASMAERTRELEEALMARAVVETFAQTITDNQPNLLAYVDTELKLRFANRAYIGWYGQRREDLIGKRIPDMADSAARGRRDAAIARVLSGEALELAYEMIGSDGKVGHFWTHRIPDIKDGVVQGYFFIATNVTELRRAQQGLEALNLALQQADAFTRVIADNVPGRLVYWDHEMRCRFVNKVFCEWHGVVREEILGRTARETLGEEKFDALAPYMAAALDGAAQQFENEELSPSGQPATSLVHFVPDVRDGAVRGIFVLVLDVTQGRRANEALQRLNEELVEARDKAEAARVAKTSFLANMSHEIRTPMNAIIGLTHLMRRENPGPVASERLTRVGEAADHLLEIINKVLDLSKIESGVMTMEESDFSVDDLIRRTVNLVEQQALDKRLTLQCDLSQLPPLLCGDLTRLSQALVNLLSNAVKFTDRGAVSLHGSVVEWRRAGLLLRFEVRDTGIGISPDRIEQVFDAFEQADSSTTRRFGGTGLGLGIARHLARLMGGDAGVTSELGAGSSFWITVLLQVAGARVQAPDAFDALAEDAIREQHEGARVLLAEDNPVNQEVAMTLLELAGMRVDVAGNGHEAVSMAIASHYDLILMDVQMPELDGLEATRRLRADERTAHVPIIAMTANAYAEDKRACLAIGMNDHLAKPVVPTVLYGMLARWLPKSRMRGVDTWSDMAAAIPELEAIEELDVDRGLAFFAGNVEVYRRGIRQFSDLYGRGIPAVDDYVRDPSIEHAEALRRELHSIGGASAAIGGTGLSELAKASGRLIQTAAPQQDVAQALRSLTDRLAQFAAHVSTISHRAVDLQP